MITNSVVPMPKPSDEAGRRRGRPQPEIHHPLVTRLEDCGLLTRYLCDTDRRAIYTDVTEAGLQLRADPRG
jgi:hypothetical protein